MSKRMLIDATNKEEMRVAVVENDVLVDFDFENISRKALKGNVYLGKIVRIEPSLQAAFVDYGGNRHGFLAFTEIHPDYFRIPVADRSRTEEESPVKDEPVLDLHASGEEIGDERDSVEDLLEQVSSTNPQEEDVQADEVQKDEVQKKVFADKSNPYRTYRIQEVIQSRQVVLVQVVKEERGNKGAAMTTYVSLAGRYCVLMPNATHAGGVSRRITDTGDRRRLKQLMQDLDVPQGMSLIVRTAGLDRSKTEIKRDYGYLMKLWGQIRELTIKANAPELIYEEANLLRRAIRDLYVREIEEVIIDGEDGYKEVKAFMKDMVPSHAKKVQRYREDGYPLFYKYKIERQIEKMYSMDVQLKSGGYIVINPTEALVSIDVNSGKATRERHIDSTALNTNLEAAEEIARQVRLRDLAGLIVIDFIDMSDTRHNHQVEKCLKDALTIDRARVQVGRISQFGLLEMSRQRLRPSIVESSTISCPTCAGAGYIRSAESFALQLVRVLEEICLEDKTLRELTVYIPSHIAFYLLSQKRHEISQLEERYQLSLDLKEDDKLSTIGFKIEHKGRFIIDGIGTHAKGEESKDSSKEDNKKTKASKKQHMVKNTKERPEAKKETEIAHPVAKVVEASKNPTVPGDNTPENQEKRSSARRQRYRGRRRRPAGPDGQQQNPSSGETSDAMTAPKPVEIKEGGQKPVHNQQPKAQVSRPSISQEKSAVQDEGKPVSKNNRKKGWWQRLLDD